MEEEVVNVPSVVAPVNCEHRILSVAWRLHDRYEGISTEGGQVIGVYKSCVTVLNTLPRPYFVYHMGERG